MSQDKCVSISRPRGLFATLVDVIRAWFSNAPLVIMRGPLVIMRGPLKIECPCGKSVFEIKPHE